MKTGSTPYARATTAGFTLVELLVVIGIIALLISILLPSLNRARRAAIEIQCRSNLRQIGQAVLQYQLAHNGCCMPTLVWGQAPGIGMVADEWAMFLVAGKYLPDQRLTPTSSPYSRSVLVCPAISDILLVTNVPGATQTGIVGKNDGFDRRLSYHIKPGLIVDFGYGINGATYTAAPSPPDNLPLTSPYFTMPSTSISIDPNTNTAPLRKMSVIKKPSQMVTFFDGTEWNPWSFIGTRITAARHGKWDSKRPWSTGIVNVLFADGHVLGASPTDLPQNLADWTGGVSVVRNRDYLFNTQQQ